MKNGFKIDGVESLDDFLKENSKSLDKTVLDSLVKGSSEMRKEVSGQMPEKLRKFKTILSVKKLPKAAVPAVLFGFFGRKANYVNRRGVKWDAFMLVYWMNYGTMALRDRAHSFITARRNVSKNKKGGIKPLNFWEKSIDSSYERALERSASDIDATIDKIADKYGFR